MVYLSWWHPFSLDKNLLMYDQWNGSLFPQNTSVNSMDVFKSSLFHMYDKLCYMFIIMSCWVPALQEERIRFADAVGDRIEPLSSLFTPWLGSLSPCFFSLSCWCSVKMPWCHIVAHTMHYIVSTLACDYFHTMLLSHLEEWVFTMPATWNDRMTSLFHSWWGIRSHHKQFKL